MYEMSQERKWTGIMLSKVEKEKIREQELKRLTGKWKEEFKHNDIKARPFLEAILKHWDKWLVNGPNKLIYRITQLLTGHGCFASYLKKIGATENEIYQECKLKRNDAKHTLFECKAFTRQRERPCRRK